MRFYHGTPFGSSREDVAKFFTGRSALIPFPRQEDLPAVAAVCSSFCFDNGAFSLWKKGGVLDVDAYIEWCYKWHRHPGFDFAIIPDIIDGTEEENNKLIKAWPSDIVGVPVYHMHEHPQRIADLAKAWPIVAIGSSGAWPNPGTGGWWNRIATVMSYACDSQGRPKCKLHGLRMMNPDIFRHLPLSSADSTNVAQNKNAVDRFGIYCPPTSSQRAAIIANRIEAHNSAPVWNKPEQTIMFDGFNLFIDKEDLAS